MKNNRSFLTVAIVTNLVSVFNFIYLSFLHYSTKFGLSEGKSICNINQKLNCDVVAVSKYASVFEIPVSNFGIMLNVISALLLLICYFELSNSTAKLLRYSLWLSFLAALASISMGLISTFALGTLCLFCIFAYILSFLQFFALLKAQSEELFFQAFKKDMTDLFTEFRYVAVFFMAIPALAWLSNSMVLSSFGLDRLNLVIEESIESWKNNPNKEFDQNFGIIANNGPQTKLTVVEFADFLCPHCRLAFKPLHQFVESRPGTKVIFKPFPLDGNCNATITTKGDNVRCELAYAAVCANSQFQKGNEVSEYIFEHQVSWNPATLENDLQKLFKETNLDPAKMKECMQSSLTHDQVLAGAKEGTGIMGTPTFFVNGKELPHAQLMPVLDAALKAIE